MYKTTKRIIDIFGSLLLIVLISPLLLPIIILLKLTGEGYIFYKQKRVGYKGKSFEILKFATMLKNSPNMGNGLITLLKDPRITPLGGFLRKTKINEIPQIFNVLLGDMSFVGPRPLVKGTDMCYSDEICNIIYQQKPGITGIGSVIFRNEEQLLTNTNTNPKEFYKTKILPYKSELEMWYNSNISLIVDIKIKVATVIVILFPKNKSYMNWFEKLPKSSDF